MGEEVLQKAEAQTRKTFCRFVNLKHIFTLAGNRVLPAAAKIKARHAGGKS